ncbi:MAG: chromate transporter [Burkholderiales bacterium]|nr:chromate transporter [Burkholderiales bacterium]
MKTLSPATIFWEFTLLSVMGFGGVMPLAYHYIVERNKWLNDKEFVEILGVSQILPGGNIINLGVMLGWKFARLKGAIAAFLGLLLIPSFILFGCAFLYNRYSNNVIVNHAFIGMSAVAAGLILSTSIKLFMKQGNRIKAMIYISIIFTLLIIFHLHLSLILIILIPLTIIFNLIMNKKRGLNHGIK